MIVWVNFTIYIEFAYPSSDKLSILRTEVEDENFICNHLRPAKIGFSSY